MFQDCRHMHVMGRRCGSPALSGQPYCYFHARSRTRHLSPDTMPTVIHPLNPDDDQRQRDPMIAQYFAGTHSTPFIFDFPTIEDRESIQVATAVTRVDDDGLSDYLVETETTLSSDGHDLALDDAIITAS